MKMSVAAWGVGRAMVVGTDADCYLPAPDEKNELALEILAPSDWPRLFPMEVDIQCLSCCGLKPGAS